MATVRESHRRAAPLGAVDGIPWGDGAADIDPPRAPAIVFETSRTFSASLSVPNPVPYSFVSPVISAGISPLAVHWLDSCDDSAWSGSSLSGAKHSFGGESALLKTPAGMGTP